MNNLVSDQKESIKECFSLWIDNISSLKANLFLVFQTVHKMWRGTAQELMMMVWEQILWIEYDYGNEF